MGKPNTSKEVDGDKLYAILYKRGKSLAELSLEMGHAKNYLTSCISKNHSLQRATIAYLDNVYGIKYEDYAPTPKIEVIDVPALPNPSSVEFDFDSIKDELYKVIYGAVYEAVKKAWQE